MRSQLFTKITRAAISELAENIRVPKGAKSYNFVSGTGQKGKFEIYTFFDEAGKIMKRNSSYINGEDTIQTISKYNQNVMKTASIINGRAESVSKRKYVWGNKDKCIFSESTTFRDSLEDVQKLTFKQKGQSPQSIGLKTSWDGTAPEITYTNMDRIFDGEKYTEYLPPLVDKTALRRYEHVYKYQMKEQDLEDVFDSFSLIRNIDLPNHIKNIKDVDEAIGIAGVFDELSGKIFYVVGNKISVADEVEVIAHEVQHAKDYSDIARLKDTLKNKINEAYYDKSRAKGLFLKTKNQKDYKRLSELRKNILNDEDYRKECLAGKHDELPIEIPAMMKGYEESENISAVWRKIMYYFGFWGV